MSNMISDISQNDQVREHTIRLLAVNPQLHEITGGVVENIDAAAVALVIVRTFMSSGVSGEDAANACLILNPHELAEQVRNYIWSMMDQSGTLNEDGVTRTVDIFPPEVKR